MSAPPHARLPFDEYFEQGMAHRFCVVASGDNLATPKFSEALLLAAQGGCLPLVFCGAKRGACPWPWADRLPLHHVATFSSVATLEQDLARLERMNASEAAARRRAASRLAPSFRSSDRALERRWTAAHEALAEMCRKANGSLEASYRGYDRRAPAAAAAAEISRGASGT